MINFLIWYFLWQKKDPFFAAAYNSSFSTRLKRERPQNLSRFCFSSPYFPTALFSRLSPIPFFLAWFHQQNPGTRNPCPSLKAESLISEAQFLSSPEGPKKFPLPRFNAILTSLFQRNRIDIFSSDIPNKHPPGKQELKTVWLWSKKRSGAFPP